MQPDGTYIQRRPQKGQERRAAQEMFIDLIGRKSLSKQKVPQKSKV
jgi:hypothetical protein